MTNFQSQLEIILFGATNVQSKFQGDTTIGVFTFTTTCEEGMFGYIQ